jgi:hypothetical protein
LQAKKRHEVTKGYSQQHNQNCHAPGRSSKASIKVPQNPNCFLSPPQAQNTEEKKRLFSQEMRHSNHDNNPTTTTASIYCKTSSKVSTSIKQCTRQLVDSPQARNQTRESPQTHNPPTDSQKKKPQTRTTTTTERQEKLNKTLQQQILAHWQG